MPCALVTALLGSLAVGMLFCRQHWYKICWCIFFKQIPGIVWVFLWQKYTTFCVSRCWHAPPLFGGEGDVCDVSCTCTLREGWGNGSNRDVCVTTTVGARYVGFFWRLGVSFGFPLRHIEWLYLPAVVLVCPLRDLSFSCVSFLLGCAAFATMSVLRVRDSCVVMVPHYLISICSGS